MKTELLQVHGEAAELYPSFRWWRAIPEPIQSIRDLDPNRVLADKPYPRDTAIYLPRHHKVAMMDVEVVLEDSVNFRNHRATLTAMPGSYTAAKEPRLLAEMQVSPVVVASMPWDFLVDILLEAAFHQPPARLRAPATTH